MTVNFFENGLLMYCHFAKNEIVEYRAFHTETESLWRRMDERLQAELTETLREHPESQHHEIVDRHSHDLYLNQARFPDIHRTALIISLWCFLEGQLNGLCQLVGESTPSPLRLRDIAGKGVTRALTYLSKVAGFDLGAITQLGFVKNANRLRNRLVHAGGILPGDPKDKLNHFVKDQGGLRGNPGECVVIAPDFIDTLAKQLTELFDDLDTQVRQLMGRINAA